jgi:primosomal protein N''
MMHHDSVDSVQEGCITMSQTRQKFATQVNSEILVTVRMLAEKEGRQLQALVEEALADLIEKRKNGKPRPHVMGVYLASHEKFGPLYKKLAE